MEVKPIAIGLGIYLLAEAAYLALLAVVDNLPPLIIWTPYVAVLICAAVTGYILRSNRLVHSLVLGILMAVIIGLSNLVWTKLGMPADFRDVSAAILLAAISLPYILVLSLAGVFVGGIWHDKLRI